MDLRRGAQKAVDKVLEVLEKNKRVITTSEEIAQVSKTPHFSAFDANGLGPGRQDLRKRG